MRRALLCVAVAALVVLAGCGGGGGDGGGDPTGDATATPATEDASTTSGGTSTDGGTETTATDDEAPGVDALAWVDGGGGIDTGTLVESHERALANESSYTVEQALERAARGDSEGTERLTTTLSASRDQSRALLTNTREFTTGDRRVTQSTAQYRVGADGEGTVYSQRNGTDGVRYEQRSPRRSFEPYYEDAAALDAPSAIAAFGFEFEETVQRDGETLYRFGADELAESGGDLRSIPQNASNVSATLLVGEDGVIHSFEYAYDTDTSAVEFSFAVADRGGTTVDEPPWLEAARDSGRLASPTPGDRRAVAWRGVA
jgi:hypothetical protein